MYSTGPLGMVLLVDDDTNISDLLKFNLSSEGFAVRVVAKAADVDVRALADVRLVICDAMNQDFTGFDLLEKIKSDPYTEPIPVIICTGSDAEDALLEAFDLGADDFITKPFSLRELIARIKAVLRRHPLRAAVDDRHRQQTTLSVPSLNLQIDTVSQRVIEDGMVLPLTKTEYSILLFLLKNQNSFFSRSEICQEVWKEEAGTNERIVDTNISRLRKKLGESGKYLINRYGLGYAFVDKLNA
ncbi:MAG: response regulator transcription factor [Bacteroidales bacterium]|nr:response regulator transcription factor [Bacteroidales bacterium]